MFSSKCETFALQVAHAWVAELFSKWGDTSARQKNWKMFVIWIGNCVVTSTEIWRHLLLSACL